MAGVAQLDGDSGGAGDDVEEDVPLGPEDHQRAQPDVGIEVEGDDARHHDREQQVRRKGRQKLRHRLHQLERCGRIPMATPIGTQMRLASAIRTVTRSRVARPSSTALPDFGEIDGFDDETSDLPQHDQHYERHDCPPEGRGAAHYRDRARSIIGFIGAAPR